MRTALRRTWAGLAALILAVLITAVPAHAIPPDGAGPDTPGTASTTSPTSGLRPGDTLNFTVHGFPAGETLYIKIDDGLNCSQAAVHGACVYHQQAIPASGTVSGSIVLPHDITPGQHWLRFLASEEMRDGSGNVIGTQGYTLRGQSFTVASRSTDSGSQNSSGSPSTGESSTSSGSGTGHSNSTNSQTGGSNRAQPETNTAVLPPAGQQPGDSVQPGAETGPVETGEGLSAGEVITVDWSQYESEDLADGLQEDDAAAEQAAEEARQFLADNQRDISDSESPDQAAQDGTVAAATGPGGFPWIGIVVLIVLLAASGMIVATMARRRRTVA
ncbi:hypothetical protein [Nesterenkonia ebinurensis]|uniref:hypothetical protein n=1 Tax=Nesterenkonia ebinurensis TaxID=2608252 RepID=UPI00123CF104|nr:hypothetical protein [Nesterenkonia ebinurensis]